MRLILYFTVTFGFLQLISASGQGLVTPQRACRIRCENGGMCAFSFDNPSIHSCICLMGVYEGDRCQYQISPTSATVSTRTHQSNKAEHYTTLKIDRQNSGGEIERNEDLRRREQLDMERRRNEDRRREYELRIEEERRRLEEKRQMTMHPTTDDKVRDEQKRMEEYRRRAEERYREEERRRDEERRREFGRREEERIRENHRKLEEERRMIEEKRQQEQKRQEDMIRIMERERSQINDRKEKDKVKEEKAEENNVEPLEETEDWDYKSDESELLSESKLTDLKENKVVMKENKLAQQTMMNFLNICEEIMMKTPIR